MSTKHTPGPWVAVRWSDDDVDAYGWSFSAGGYLLPLSDLETDNPDECDANARLIAATPDLLNAVRFLLNNPDNRISRTDRDAANAAITKATGI